jgi:Rrf2 family protein
MISQAAEYALRSVICLAQGEQRTLTTHEIAAVTHVPAGYLAKVMQALVKAGIVRSQRGVHGGFELIKQPGQLTLLQVVRVVDASQRVLACPLGIEPHGINLCPLHRRLDAAAEAAERLLDETTIGQLLADAAGPIPLTPAPITALAASAAGGLE